MEGTLPMGFEDLEGRDLQQENNLARRELAEADPELARIRSAASSFALEAASHLRWPLAKLRRMHLNGIAPVSRPGDQFYPDTQSSTADEEALWTLAVQMAKGARAEGLSGEELLVSALVHASAIVQPMDAPTA